MALQKTITHKEINISDAYIRIQHLAGDKNKMEVYVEYKATAGSEAFYQEVFSFTPSVETSSDNFLKQAYTYLKTLQKFEGVVDV